MKYRLTVWIDGVESDSSYFNDRAERSVLTFYTEVVNGKFARAFASLVKSNSISPNAPLHEKQRSAAIKSENAFIFDRNYRFLIESELGIAERETDDEQDSA